MPSAIRPQAYQINRRMREDLLVQKGRVIWFTGLSGSGKSTLANALATTLHEKGFKTYVLDGDNTRLGLNKDLGFQLADRTENIRRLAEVAKLFTDAGLIVLVAAISPLESDRLMAREIIGEKDLSLIHVDCSIEHCESRDVKGLYASARSGELPEFTGISSPYELPEQADLRLQTDSLSTDACLQLLMDHILPKLQVA